MHVRNRGPAFHTHLVDPLQPGPETIETFHLAANAHALLGHCFSVFHFSPSHHWFLQLNGYRNLPDMLWLREELQWPSLWEFNLLTVKH